jgi:hypothetical protein
VDDRGDAIAVAGVAISYMRAPAQATEMRFDITTPGSTDSLAMALSPDGSRLVVSAWADGPRLLWLRSLGSTSWQPLAGTEGGSWPFWSPDSRSVGFFAGGKLKLLEIQGGVPQTLADASARGGAWSAEGVILFARNPVGALSRIQASGGEPVVVTTRSGLQVSHYSPFFLPDGRRFLYFATGPPDTRGVPLRWIHGHSAAAADQALRTPRLADLRPPGRFWLSASTSRAVNWQDPSRSRHGRDAPAGAGFSTSPADSSPIERVVQRTIVWTDRSEGGVFSVPGPRLWRQGFRRTSGV